MLYLLIKPVMRLAIWLYYGKVHREGLRHIDNGRPSLILANHTASFMDAMITAVYVKRRIWFFTRGDIFRYRRAAAIMRSLGMLPVYRMRDGKERLRENESSNDEALRILGRGGAVLIFAEGESSVEKILKPAKKGPFRLAVRAAATLKPPPVIVPFGINYVLPAAPFGDAYLVAGAPFEIPDGDEATATRRATELMRHTWTGLSPLCWHVRQPALRPAAQFLLEHFDRLSPDRSFANTKKLTDSLDLADDHQAGAGVLTDWQEFKLWQREHPLPQAYFRRKASVPDILTTICGLPLALTGWVLHAIPLSLARFITTKKVKEPDFVSPVFLCLALVFNIVWYAAVVTICFVEEHPDRLWIPLALMPLSGLFLVKRWWPAALRTAAPAARAGYREKNPDTALLQRLFESLLRYGRQAISR